MNEANDIIRAVGVGATLQPIIGGEPCTLDNFVSPFTVAPKCYQILAEDDDWFIGKMTMEAGEQDPPHSHLDHLVYVLEGDGITIYPGKESSEDTKMEVPIKPGMAMPVHTGHHVVKNTGSKTCELVFFELKPPGFRVNSVPPPPPAAMLFGGGKGPGANLDCCTTNPKNYKVVAETSGGRLVEMTLPPGK